MYQLFKIKTEGHFKVYQVFETMSSISQYEKKLFQTLLGFSECDGYVKMGQNSNIVRKILVEDSYYKFDSVLITGSPLKFCRKCYQGLR